jgi:deoxyribodipyrimidine photo-lyase
MRSCLYWFRNDLRLRDNLALHQAVKKKLPLTLIYIDDDQERTLQRGPYQKAWLHNSLMRLEEDLHQEGHRLHFFKGNAKKILNHVIEKTGAEALYWNRCYEPELMERDGALKKEFKERGLEVETFPGFLLMEPWELKNSSNEYFKVFTPFWKSLSQKMTIQKPLAKPHFESTKTQLGSLKIDDLHLLGHRVPDLTNQWWIGEKEAMKRLQTFIKKGLPNYAQGRDFPGMDATSKLSANLHFGEISPQQILYAVDAVVQSENDRSLNLQKEKFFSELGWREFSYHLLFHFPELPSKPFKPQYASFPWKKNARLLSLWQEGMTGYPIIDAGMRQLKQTGWMHNRIRMVVGSFLVKNLMIHWHEGEKWFFDHLVDADLANNSASWQWVFGSGADAAPYFRVFNPLLQSAKFDPEGEYIRTYVPELRHLDLKYLHDPSRAPENILRQAGIVLGTTYPHACCDLNATRDEVLKAYQHVQKEKP